MLLIGCQWIEGPALHPLRAMADEFKLPIAVEATPADLGRELKADDGRQTVESNLTITNVGPCIPDPIPDPLFARAATLEPADIPVEQQQPAHTAAEPVKGSSPRTGEAAEVSAYKPIRWIVWPIAGAIGLAIGRSLLALKKKGQPT